MKIIRTIWFPIKEVLKKIRDLGYRNILTEKIIPVKEQILLESKPDFSDNTYSLYLEMLKEGLNKKYHIVWLVTKNVIDDKYKEENVSFFNISKKGLLNKFKLNMLINQSKYIFTCNRVYKRKTNRQVIIYLNHGSPLKDLRKLKINFSHVDESITMSNYFIDADAANINLNKDKFYVNGFPRNDGLFIKNDNIKKLFHIDNEKMIIWLPTFRKYEDDKRVDSSFDMPLGIPIIYNIDELKKLNKILKENNTKIILKPHFAAKINELKIDNLSNFIIINNDYLKEYDITLYELLGQSDGLITDYSSVYYDYLLMNKPIGLTLDDFDDYKEHTGFIYDYYSIINGYYIYKSNELYDFIKDIDKDTMKKKRNETIKKLQLDMNGNYSEKLLKHFINKFHI